MSAVAEMFEVERLGDTSVLTPQRELRQLEHKEIERELRPVLADPAVRSVVVDCGHKDVFGWTTLGLFNLTWLLQRLRQRGEHLAFCNVSAHERELLTVTGLDTVWPIYPSREDAIRAVT